MRDTINVSWRTIIIVAIIVLLLFVDFAIFFGIRPDNQVSTKSNLLGSSQGIPEKCKLPSGQDVSSWKEHLGHHAETQECLQYFE